MISSIALILNTTQELGIFVHGVCAVKSCDTLGYFNLLMGSLPVLSDSKYVRIYGQASGSCSFMLEFTA